MSPPLRLCRPVSSPSAEENVDNINTVVFLLECLHDIRIRYIVHYYSIKNSMQYNVLVYMCECVRVLVVVSSYRCYVIPRICRLTNSEVSVL